MPRRPAPLVTRAWWAASLVALLLATQALGLWHRTVHGPLATAHEHVEHVERIHDASTFGHDAGQTEQCRLFDQLTLADSLLVAVVALPPDAPRPTRIEVVATTTARSAEAPYEARAPPIRA